MNFTKILNSYTMEKGSGKSFLIIEKGGGKMINMSSKKGKKIQNKREDGS